MFMPEIDKETMGGTMRLGARMTKFTHKFPDGAMSTTYCWPERRNIVDVTDTDTK
jgi:hypothetical protein